MAKAANVKQKLIAWLSLFNKQLELAPVRKAITSDNGREFLDIASLENDILSIFFAYPYLPWERGLNERYSGLPIYFILKDGSSKKESEGNLYRTI